MSKKILYDFEGFRVDIEQNCLWRGEELISLTPKAFQTLVVLIKNKGRVMSKNALLDEIWKDTFVEESTLAQNISTLRKTLAKYDREGKEFIATVPRRGYRFVAEVTEISSDEEVLYVEKRSVTHIVAEQEEIDDRPPLAAVAEEQRKDAEAVGRTGLFGGKMLVGAVVLIAAAILLAGFLLVSYFSPADNFYQTKFRNFRLHTLFSGRDIGAVAAAPDGKYVAVVEVNPAGDAILLKQTAAGNAVEVLPRGSGLTIAGVAFSPGGEHIYYAAYKNRDPAPKYGKLYRVPVLGGAPQEILRDIDSPPALSADGRRLAFVRNKLEAKQTALVIAGADGSGERELAVRDLRSGFSRTGLSFSPDGRQISAVVADRDDERRPVKLITIDTETGGQKTLAAEKNWLWAGQAVWLGDGSGIALVAYGSESPNLTDEIWLVSYPEGKTRVITNGLKGINGISLTNDLSSIVATRQNRVAGLFVGPADDPDRAAEIARTAEAEELLPLGADWTPAETESGGARLVFAKTVSGSADIWSVDPDGSRPRQLTSNPAADFAPAATADGRYIFFLSNRGQGAAGSIWRMTADGGDQTEIIRARFLFPPTVSGKNDFIYYSAKSTDKPHNVLWRADLDGKNAGELTSIRTFAPRVSPDGRYVFCFYPDAGEDPEDLTKPLRLTVLRAADGRVFRQYAALKNRRFPIVEWKADSSGFLFVEKENGRTTLFSQPLAGGDPETVKKWADEDIYQIALSRDGRRLFFEKGREVTSVVALKDLGRR